MKVFLAAGTSYTVEMLRDVLLLSKSICAESVNNSRNVTQRELTCTSLFFSEDLGSSPSGHNLLKHCFSKHPNQIEILSKYSR